MTIIIFLVLAFFIVFLSIKLSMYADIIDKKTNLGGFLIGGLILAAITSFPELVTCLSAIAIGNPNLAIGDILGSNIFNLLIIAFFDVYFFRLKIFRKISKNYIKLVMLITMLYIVLWFAFKDLWFNPSIVSFFILVSYIIFVVLLSKIKTPDKEMEIESNVKNITLKFILAAVSMILLSIAITMQADAIGRANPAFSSSTVGAFLLGVTTSLPEVVTCYALIKIGSYNLALANIIGSNAFNFMILGICDFFVKGQNLYSFREVDSFTFLFFGFLMHAVLILSLLRSKKFPNALYTVPSGVILFIYFYIFYLQFF